MRCQFAASLAAQLRVAAGRIGSYALLGSIVGSLGWAVGEVIGRPGVLGLRIAFGALMVWVGLSIAGWLPGLGPLEAVGARVWAHISPLFSRVIPVDTPARQLAAGAIWGWLPCGLVYAALTGAAATGSGAAGALMMLCFGLGTVPAVMGMGLLADRLGGWTSSLTTRRLAGLTLMVFGLWTALGPVLMAMQSAGHSAHVH